MALAVTAVQVDPIAAATYFVQVLGCTAFPVWATRPDGTCRCGDPHDGTGKAGRGPDNIGKHPATEHGFQDATADVGRIRTFLKNPGTPNYGLNAPEGVLVVDVDGDADLRRWEELQATYGLLPITLTTTTANGRHYFFRWPTAAGPMPTGKLFGYVVRRHDDGYVIGPGSVHPSGVMYDTLRQASGHPYDIADLPLAWAEAAVRPAPKLTIVGPAPLPEKGHRHDWLRDRARNLRGVIDEPAVLRAALLAENSRLAEPKTEAEVDIAIGDVFAKFQMDPPEVTEERAAARLGDDDLDLLGVPASGTFPAPPAREAFGGLVGELVDDLIDGTDASEVALLGATVAFLGALVPGSAYFHRDQTSSPFIALVGESAIGRKGTAMIRVMDAMSDALERQTVHRVVLDGVNSGEGLVATLSYRREHFSSEPTAGLIFEEEYATLLASRGRDGSTLDPKMRQAFDGSPLSNRKSGETKTVMPNYWLPALIGITPAELRLRLEPGALLSGSANRWLYLPVVRRDVVPTNAAPRFSPDHKDRIAAAHRAALRNPPLLQVDPTVTATLAAYAEFLPTASAGLARDLTRRLGIIAFRVALVHALIEGAVTVLPQHLDRALALTEYARRGIDWVFGDTIGNPDANLLFRHLDAGGRLSGRTITRQIIRDPIRRQGAIDELVRLGRAVVVTIQTAGRPRTELSKGLVGGAFVPFVQGSAMSTPENAENVELMDKSAQGLGQKPDKSLPEGGQKVSEVGAEWLSPCHFYRDHQTAHRQTPKGWVCDICRPDGVDTPTKEDPR